MAPIEFIILFIIASSLKSLLEVISIQIYSAITGKELKEVKVKWSYKK